MGFSDRGSAAAAAPDAADRSRRAGRPDRGRHPRRAGPGRGDGRRRERRRPSCSRGSRGSTATVRETMPRLRNLGLGSAEAYSVMATATDYLPEAIGGYLRLPGDWADTRPIEGGKTSLMMLIDQLDLLGRDDGQDLRRGVPGRRGGADRARAVPAGEVRPRLQRRTLDAREPRARSRRPARPAGAVDADTWPPHCRARRCRGAGVDPDRPAEGEALAATVAEPATGASRTGRADRRRPQRRGVHRRGVARPALRAGPTPTAGRAGPAPRGAGLRDRAQRGRKAAATLGTPTPRVIGNASTAAAARAPTPVPRPPGPRHRPCPARHRLTERRCGPASGPDVTGSSTVATR